MKTLKLLVLLFITVQVANADVFSDIKKAAGTAPETFWEKSRIHLKPANTTYGESAYNAVTVNPKISVFREEMCPCISCNRTMVDNVAEYVFNMYLRTATSSQLSYLEKCTGDQDTTIGLEALGIFDPLYMNRNSLSILINNGALTSWYNKTDIKALGQKRLAGLFTNIGITYTENTKCETLFLRILEKSMAYYGINKSLKVANPDYKKVEPLFLYSTLASTVLPSKPNLAYTNSIFGYALKKTTSGGAREFVCYMMGQEADYSEFDGPGVKKINKVDLYTYRPVKDECRVLAYVVGSELLNVSYKYTDVYEIWAVPHTMKNVADKDNYVTVNSGIKLANGKVPSKKWTYHVAIVAVMDGVPFVLDGLFFKEAVSLADWQKLFDPSTRFAVKPFIKTNRIDAAFCTSKFIQEKGAKPHPVFE